MIELNTLKLAVNSEDQRTFGPCECCGEMTSRVWGYVEHLNATIAAYFVEWTPGHERDQANFDLILGKWGENQDASSRQAVAVEFRKLETGPAFMVVDATSRSIASSDLVSTALLRDDVIGSPIANDVFAICDVVFLEDPRLIHLRS